MLTSFLGLMTYRSVSAVMGVTLLSGLVLLAHSLNKTVNNISKVEKCPKCGWPMLDCGWISLFSGAVDKESQQQYKPFGVRIHQCPKCKLEKHEKIDRPQLKFGLYDYDLNVLPSLDSRHYEQYLTMPVNYKRIYEKEYNEIVTTANSLIFDSNEKYNQCIVKQDKER